MGADGAGGRRSRRADGRLTAHNAHIPTSSKHIGAKLPLAPSGVALLLPDQAFQRLRVAITAAPMIITAASATDMLGVSLRTHSSVKVDNRGCHKAQHPEFAARRRA